MNRVFAKRNLESLMFVAKRLEELCTEVTFVGGSIIGLLVNDKAAPDVRFTLDVDCITSIATLIDYHALERKLQKKGFKQDIQGDAPICRWHYDEAILDIVPIEKHILGFSNRWYKEALDNAIEHDLSDTIAVNIISAPYLIATKLEAFKDRGENDFLISHDLEDIISLIDGRIDTVEEIGKSSQALRCYLAKEFNQLVENEKFLQALPGHLNYLAEVESRRKIVLERIDSIISMGG